MALPVENERELVIGGFQGIKKIRGLLIGINVEDPPASWENREKQVVKVDMEETTVLEMFGDEEPMELKEGKFSFFIPYTEAGKKPHQNSIYSKCWLASAKEQGKVPSEFMGQYVTLEKQPRLLFQTYEIDPDTKKAKVDENGDKIKKAILAVNEMGLPNHFCFVSDETADTENVKEKAKKFVVGYNEKAALRNLLVNMKQHPEFKEALNNGTLAEMLGLKRVDGKFAEK